MNVLFELDKTYEQGKADGAKEVLEQIKTEMLTEYQNNTNIDNVTHSKYVAIINKHIKENKE